MAEAIPFWQRVGRLFRSGSGNGPPRATGEAGRSSAVASSTATLERSGALQQRSVLGAPPESIPWWRPQARRARAEAAGQRVAELALALEEHFRKQDDRAAALANSLDRVGSTLAQLADSQRLQGELLKCIAEHTDSAAKSAAGVVSTLAHVPESLNAQAEAIRGVARQLEIGQESDNQLMHSLQQFGRAVDTLGTSGTAQVEALQRLSTAQQHQNEAFAKLVTEQSRRYVAVVIGTSVLAVAAIAVAVITLVLQGR